MAENPVTGDVPRYTRSRVLLATALLASLPAGCVTGFTASGRGVEIDGDPPLLAESSLTLTRLPPVCSSTSVQDFPAVASAPLQGSRATRIEPAFLAESSLAITRLPPVCSSTRVQDSAAVASAPVQASRATRVERAFLVGDSGGTAVRPFLAHPVRTEWSDAIGPVVRASGNESSDAAVSAEEVQSDRFGENPVDVEVNLRGAAPTRLIQPEVLPIPSSLPPITLHLDDVDIRKVLEMLSREGAISILVSPGVQGRVTANIEEMDFDQALGAILKLCNLVAHRERELIFVYTPTEHAELEDREQGLVTRVYHLSYVRASDIQMMIMPFLSPDVGKQSITPASDVGIASDTGQVGGDSLAGGEVLIIQDREAAINTIDDIVARVDVRPVQVVIEAVIMEAILEDGLKLGVNFSVLDGAGKAVTVLGSGAAINAAAGFTPAGVLTAAAGLIDDVYPKNTVPPPNDQSIQSGGALRKGFANNDNGLKFGFVDDDVTGFIDALEQVGDINVLASPRVMVLNKQRAELIVGEKLGFLTMTVTETTSMQNFEQEEVGTQLRLRPFVAPDGMIRMEIHPERSSGTLVNGVPQTRTSEVTTNVVVPNAATIVIAGLIEEEEVVAQNGIPLFSRLPLVGALFRYKSTTTVKKELIVLLTPRIWDPNEESPLEHPASHLRHENVDIWQ